MCVSQSYECRSELLLLVPKYCIYTILFLHLLVFSDIFTEKVRNYVKQMKMNTVGPSDSVDGINEESPPVFVVDPEAGSSNQQETNNSCLPMPEDQIR